MSVSIKPLPPVLIDGKLRARPSPAAIAIADKIIGMTITQAAKLEEPHATAMTTEHAQARTMAQAIFDAIMAAAPTVDFL